MSKQKRERELCAEGLSIIQKSSALDLRSLALKISVILGHTDKSSLSFESVKTLHLFVCTQNNNETLRF